MSGPIDAGGAALPPVVILCRPQMGENVGAAARAMLNFGLSELRLVSPSCGWPNAKAVVAASGAAEVLNGTRIFDSLNGALADLHHTFAATARPRGLDKDVAGPDEAAREARRLSLAGRRVGLVFGPERTGLTNDELLLADAIISIPVNPGHASLNLAQAVLLCAYEWLRAGASPARADGAGDTASEDAREPATKAEVAGLVEHLVRELDEVDFFRSPSRRGSLVHAITVMLERRRLARPEVHLLRGIVKDLSGGRRARPRPILPGRAGTPTPEGPADSPKGDTA
jgi:tRNA/rRNA methyltransferase